MMPFLLYQLKAALCIMAFTIVYYLFFRKETFYRFNRVYLISSLILSFIIPGIHFAPIAAETTGVIPVVIGAVTVYTNKVADAGQQSYQPAQMVSLIYICISLVFAVYLIFQLMRMLTLVSHNNVSTHDDHKLVILSKGSESFSFFNMIFIHPGIADIRQHELVVTHELIHSRQLHSFDLIIIQLTKIFQWFNPFIYFLERAINETHEYLADAAVLEQDGRSDRYRLLLLAQVFGVQPGIFSFFNHSLIKNRLTMMTKEKSPSRNRLKYLAALPLVLIMGLFMCFTLDRPKESLLLESSPSQQQRDTVKNVVPVTASKKQLPPPPTQPAKDFTNIEPGSPDEPPFMFVEKDATFQGGDLNTFRDWVQMNLVYPPVAVDNGIFGRVTVQFVVNSVGKVTDVTIIRGVDPSLDKETIRVIESSPDWTPPEHEGKMVKQLFTMPVIFQLK